MESYTVRYKLEGAWFWRTIKRVTGDGIQTYIVQNGEVVCLPEPYRFFMTEDNMMIHVPWKAQVIFSKERDAIITKKMSRQAGQQVQRA